MKKSLLTVMMAGLMIFSAVSTFAKSNEVDKIKKNKVLKVGCKEDVLRRWWRCRKPCP